VEKSGCRNFKPEAFPASKNPGFFYISLWGQQQDTLQFIPCSFFLKKIIISMKVASSLSVYNI
jgi:hypothetical protein